MKRQHVAAALALAAMNSLATAATLHGDRPEYQPCIERASKAFGISPLPIRLLLDVEGGTVGRTSQNRNTTVDMGPMQINSSWLPKLARLGISRDDVLNDVCVNIAVGTWIFVSEWQRTPNDVVGAIARYNSRTPHYQARYLGMVTAAIDRRLKRLEQPAGASATQSLVAAK